MCIVLVNFKHQITGSASLYEMRQFQTNSLHQGLFGTIKDPSLPLETLTKDILLIRFIKIHQVNFLMQNQQIMSSLSDQYFMKFLTVSDQFTSPGLVWDNKEYIPALGVVIKRCFAHKIHQNPSSKNSDAKSTNHVITVRSIFCKFPDSIRPIHFIRACLGQ